MNSKSNLITYLFVLAAGILLIIMVRKEHRQMLSFVVRY